MFLSPYQTLQSTSPPTPALLASRPVITPCDVVEDRGAEPAEHRGHRLAAEVDAAAGTAHPLESGDHAFAARTVLEGDPDHLLRRLRRRRVVDQLEAADVPLGFQNAGDFELQLRRGHVHARVARLDGIANPREHVGNRVCHTLSSWAGRRAGLSAPARAPRQRGSRGLATVGPALPALLWLTSCSWSHPRPRPSGRAHGNRDGTGRTSAGRPADGRIACSGCGRAPGISVRLLFLGNLCGCRHVSSA